jgi:hypothetical protein
MWERILSFILSVISVIFPNGSGWDSNSLGYVYQVVAVGGQIGTFFPIDTLMACLNIALVFELVVLFFKVIVVVNTLKQI